ncbi:hypothetical protein COCOR_03557 [Corallococcus coralloides DSM 2259]|uniref:Uncharacterized protein n=1 Tax=Corallococcus coralloides (strain ATCC 25202 / DSM 2259 / NBRC 100086 / M2) TaxID=1144275 RepID=H8MLZ4_CORCM|nr:hypothetical protein [Corallococcus coralloides]AFE05302.1 hypothetical protein COCOR_03557 [Corallococcus coralloides DSM 2259]
MKAFRSAIVAALFLSLPALAAPTVHSIWSSRGLYVADSTGRYPVTSSNTVVAWNQSTNTAFVNFHGFAGGNEYDFELVGSPAIATTVDDITGIWNIRRNGAFICTGCSGTAYWLSLPAGAGNYFKFYDSTNVFHFSAYIDARKDY